MKLDFGRRRAGGREGEGVQANSPIFRAPARAYADVFISLSGAARRSQRLNVYLSTRAASVSNTEDSLFFLFVAQLRDIAYKHLCRLRTSGVTR